MSYTICADLSHNISTWAPCIQDAFFFGDPLVFGVFILFFFAIAMWKLNLGQTVMFPVATILLFALLTGFAGFSIMVSVFWVIMLIAFAFLFLSFLKRHG